MRLVALLVAALVLAGCSTPAIESEPPTTISAATTPATQPAPTPTTSSPPPAPTPDPKIPIAQLNVTMRDNAFLPANILVPQGATVTWTNEGERAHTMTLDDGSFSSGSIPPGETAAHAFAEPGSYAYHCAIHASMKGTVVVNASSAPPVPPATDPTPPPPAPEPGRFVVNITNMAFSPSTLRVPVNSTIEFRNADSVPHTATSTFQLFDSGPMQPGTVYNATLTRANNVFYTCQFHPDMRAQIIVE